MTTDGMMPLELMTRKDDTDQSAIITGPKSCYDNVELALLPRIIMTIFLLISSACHLLVIIVCIRQRKKATYKQDIVYMVALAIVDMLSCLSAPAMRPDVRQTNIALKSVLPLLTYMSVILLTIRAVDRFNIFIRKQAKPWSFRFQIILCLVSNLFVTVPITYSNLLTKIPFASIFGFTASFIILVSYVAIVCKLLQQARKSSLRISPTQPKQPMMLSERQINVTKDAHFAMEEGQSLKGSLSLGTATDQSTGPPSTHETDISFNETSQTPNVVMINHSSLRPDHIVKVKRPDQLKSNEVILAQTRKHMIEENKEASIAQTSKQFVYENEEMVSEETIKHPGKEQKAEVLAQNSKQLGKKNRDVLFAQSKETFGKENREVDQAKKSTQIKKERGTEENREVHRTEKKERKTEENEEMDCAQKGTQMEKKRRTEKNGEVDHAEKKERKTVENEEMDCAQKGTQMRKERRTEKNGKVDRAEKKERETVENEEMDCAQKGTQMGQKRRTEKNREVDRAEKKERKTEENEEVDRAQKSTQMGKERRTEEDREVHHAPKRTQMRKERRSDVPLHVNKNQILTTRRNKGKHLRRASLSLVLITIIFYLSWIPAWIRDISDSVPCYLIFLVFVNCTVNPFIYLITLKTFRQESYNVLSIPFRRLCKSN